MGDMRDGWWVIRRNARWNMWGYVLYAGRTTSPKSPRPGCRFWGRPPIQEGRQMGTENNQRSKKKNAYFQFKLLIINDINQYFNIHLHLISFIIYNR